MRPTVPMTRRGCRPPVLRTLLALGLVCGLAIGPPAASAQTAPADPPASSPPAQTPSTPAPAPEVTVPVTSAQLDRIKKALGDEPALRLDDDQLRFYVEILAKKPSFAEFIKGYDFKNGPTRRGNPMTHQEFLSMVTPREFNSSGGITAMETLQFAVTNWLGQALVKRAIEEMAQAKTEREIQDIRDRIERELAALRNVEAR